MALVLFGYTVPEDLQIAIIAFFATLFTLFIIRVYVVSILHRISKKSKNNLDDFIIDGIKALHAPFYVYLSLYVATHFLSVTPNVSKILWIVLLVVIIYYAGKLMMRIVNHYAETHIEKRVGKGVHSNASMVRVLALFVNVAIWSVAFLLVLSNLGVNITPLIAGLGVGGIAIAFALQNILEDIFSAFSIYFDKPFKEGDFIIVGKDMGVVKHIGIKTTRVQALEGQELVFSNRELTSTRINNYKKMEKRRVSFQFGVIYGTSNKKLKQINEIVVKTSKHISKITLDRVHFKSFGAYSLDYEVVYYIDTNDYNIYMDVQQEFNLKLKEEFEKAGIEMAFPTQTLIVEKGK